jgi:opacity protein-like surface antigen
MKRTDLLAAALLLCLAPVASAQQPQQLQQPEPAATDTRTQYPALLANSFFSVNVGRIDYPFSAAQLEPGFTAGAIEIPRVTVRVALFGHQFNRYLSAQATYMRPVQYVSYRTINGAEGGHHVWMHFGGVTLRPQLPNGPRVTLYGEAGLGITSRSGFELGETPVVRDANFGSALFGAGLDYHLTPTWDLTAGLTYLRGSGKDNQPRTLFSSGGFRYNMRPLPAAVVAANREAGFIFPKQLVQLEVTTGVGYGVNTFLSRNVPVFWGGNVKVDRGVAVHYDRNVFHTRRIFSFDVGTSASYWRSRDDRQRFTTLSLYPLFRLTLVRSRTADYYFQYSLAGPTFISEQHLDGRETGRRFTFQDFMGIGAFIGAERRLTAGVKINHYSNGNIFTENAGVKVPLTVTLGYTF